MSLRPSLLSAALLVLTGMLVRPVRAQQSDSVALQADSVVLEDSLPSGERLANVFASCRTPRTGPPRPGAPRQGRAVLSFVVDTRGRVMPSTITVVSTTDSLWALQAADMARTCRYRPGQVDGRPVKVRIERPFRFDFP
jgi:TonB family protein